MFTKIIGTIALSSLALVACERRENRPAEQRYEPIGGGPTAQLGEREKARDRLASARCEHYRSCGDIAQDKKYDTLDSCLTRQKADLDKDWDRDDCGRIDSPRLEACLSAVSAKSCDAMFESSPSECAQSKVCIK